MNVSKAEIVPAAVCSVVVILLSWSTSAISVCVIVIVVAYGDAVRDEKRCSPLKRGTSILEHVVGSL